MWGRAGKRAIVGILVLLVVSCARLPSASPEEGGLATETLSDKGSIPAEWGSLVSVYDNPVKQTTWLWFEDEEGNVRAVLYHRRSEELYSTVRLIRRR